MIISKKKKTPLVIIFCRIPPVHWKGVTQPQQWSLTNRTIRNDALQFIGKDNSLGNKKYRILSVLNKI